MKDFGYFVKYQEEKAVILILATKAHEVARRKEFFHFFRKAIDRLIKLIYITTWQEKMKFEWDIKKEDINKRKHKINFSEACLVFADRYLLTLFDDKHSIEEDRWITMGQTPNGEILVVIHTYMDIEGEETIRIISARMAEKKEIEQYFKRRL